MRVRTAASACSREGLGSTGVGTARTCSDKPCFGHGFTLVFFTSMTGLSVRPALAQRAVPEVSPGWPRQSSTGPYSASRGTWTPHSHSAWLLPCRREEPLLAPSGPPLYIRLHGLSNPPDLHNR